MTYESNSAYKLVCDINPESSYSIGNYRHNEAAETYGMLGKNTKYEHATCTGAGIGIMNINNL